ncbi:hypothetical protein DRJ48_00135 [Candidatus Woesearchaeota archaeon]|nr:MAG: hypothetical protein DRJ48_00135 [Candidatus Woesearchaeota archaeon]
MVGDEKKEVCPYSIEHEGEETILVFNCNKCSYSPSIEDNKVCMAQVIERLSEAKATTKLVFSQKRNYEYDTEQTELLKEIARVYSMLIKDKESFNIEKLNLPGCARLASAFYMQIKKILFELIKEDPIGAYVKVRRLIRLAKIELDKESDPNRAQCIQNYIGMLGVIERELGRTKLIKLAKPYLPGYKLGERDVYRKIFTPTIKPDFMYTKLMSTFPSGAEEIDTYKINEETEVSIFKLKDTVLYLYHVIPPEFNLSEEKYELLDQAKKILSAHEPSEQEFVDPKRMRQVFLNVGHDLIEELAEYNNIKLTEEEKNQLARILVRYTVGFGLIEVLLQDQRVQDITINSPTGQSPIFLVHEIYGECKTNIIPTPTEVESWATKLRMISGRPLDEANPILDTGIILPGAKARVAVISKPLNPSGLAFAFRRHRDKPWTLPLFIKNRMLTPLAAGLLSFLIDGARTILIAGTRSAGKTSLLGALLTEIMRKYRIITIEDTLELPTEALREMNYNIQHMKVASAMTKGTSEVPADEGLRTTLRLGDSCLIIGEVRSTEALALYEAMRVGAMANVVAGTIHGDSPYGVYDRVVNDLGVPKTSFKATDIVVVCNPIKSPDGLHKWRRVTQISEIRKEWEEDPLREHGFVDLMKYDAKEDKLKPTKDLLEGEVEVLKKIAENVKEWAGDWDAVWDNILLRAKVKERLVEVSDREKMPELLEAEFVIQCNDEFHRICEKVAAERGRLDSKRIFLLWDDWLKKTVEKLKQE